jgi:hypothetical protein
MGKVVLVADYGSAKKRLLLILLQSSRDLRSLLILEAPFVRISHEEYAFCWTTSKRKYEIKPQAIPSKGGD